MANPPSFGVNPTEFWCESGGNLQNVLEASFFACVLIYFYRIVGTPAECWAESCGILMQILWSFVLNPAGFSRMVLEAAFGDVSNCFRIILKTPAEFCSDSAGVLS